MRCFVTGATGFVGANVVHALVEQGHEVRALVRPESDRRGLEGLQWEPVIGDLLNREALLQGLRGCDWCFHVAASYQLWLRDYRPMYEANVEGTRAVIESAAKAGCSRIVYTSTVGCIGLPHPHRSPVTPTSETAPLLPGQMSNHYKRSKWQAEKVALDFASRGLPVVVVNPSAPVGPRDIKPTPTGQVIVDFLTRRLPAYLDTGLNWVHVRDVAIGHILAAQKGRIGERYILGHAQANWTMRETLSVLAELTGLPAPAHRVPYLVALSFAYLSEAMAKINGKPPRAPIAGVRMAKYKMFFDPQKAISELGLPQTAPRQAFTEAIEWFKIHGKLQN